MPRPVKVLKSESDVLSVEGNKGDPPNIISGLDAENAMVRVPAGPPDADPDGDVGAVVTVVRRTSRLIWSRTSTRTPQWFARAYFKPPPTTNVIEFCATDRIVTESVSLICNATIGNGTGGNVN